MTERREYIVLALMLLFLDFSIWQDIGSALSRALMLIHLGLFLIWQPIQQSRERFAWYNGVIFIALTLAFVYWINWWIISGWLILLIGIVGGRVVVNKIERNVYLLVMIFLVSELLIGCIPRLFTIQSITPVYDLLKYGMLVIPLVLPFFPAISGQKTVAVDFLHAITTSLLTGLLVMGSLVIMFHSGADYFIALIQTLLVIALCLFGVSWLLSPHAGFSGLSQLWTRSLLNIGTPFEQWLNELSVLREEHQSADEFLESAMEKMISLQWIVGTKWSTPDSEGSYGEITKNEIFYRINNNPACLYTHMPISGALLLHCNLLMQLVENFYVAKINERELAKQAQLHAIYETGARITHDIKNLLQSMHSMIAILQADTDSTDSKSFTILKKQFPYFIQRLELAMNKLQTPEQSSQEKVYLKDWWRELHSYHKEFDIEFVSDIQGDPLISVDLFESVIENLLENAISKKREDKDIKITASATCRNNTISMTVRDTGNEIEKKTANLLFKEPLKSDNGLGIGLLQAFKQAESSGYTLSLKNNTDGNVCFELLSQN